MGVWEQLHGAASGPASSWCGEHHLSSLLVSPSIYSTFNYSLLLYFSLSRHPSLRHTRNPRTSHHLTLSQSSTRDSTCTAGRKQLPLKTSCACCNAKERPVFVLSPCTGETPAHHHLKARLLHNVFQRRALADQRSSFPPVAQLCEVSSR